MAKKPLKVFGVLSKITLAKPQPGILPHVEIIGTLTILDATKSEPKPRPTKN